MRDISWFLVAAWYFSRKSSVSIRLENGGTDMQDYNSCRCGCTINYDWGVIVAERHPFCPKNYSIWEIKRSQKKHVDGSPVPKHTIRLKIVPLMHRRESDLLLIFDGLSRGNPILYDSRVPNKFPFNSEFVSSGNSARVEYRTKRLAKPGNDSFFRGTIIYFEFLDQNGASLRFIDTSSASSLSAKSPFLIIFLFVCFVSFSGIFIWLCFLRRKRPRLDHEGNVNPMAKDDGNEDPSVICYNPAFLPASLSHPAITVESPRRYQKCPSRLSGPDLDHSERALISQSSLAKETRTVGIQLSSPALFLKHFHPSQDGLNSARSRNGGGANHMAEVPVTSRSSGRGESPLSLDNLDFEYDEEDFLGGGPRLDPLQTVVIN